MALEFDRATPVVDFGATSSPLKWDARRWVLWPAFAYRVMLPGSTTPPFNIIQQGVLEMCRAGVRNLDGISNRLALPVDLVRFVVEQLRGMDSLDGMDMPTPRAIRLLDEGGEPSEVEESGYVFIDGHSLRLWPRVHRGSLPVIETEFEQGKARFQRGTQGKPETIFATTAWATPGIQPRTPSAYEAQKAARHHARRVRAFRREAPRSRHDDDVLDGLKSSGLRVIGTDPEPIFVAACVFLPKDTQQKSWLVTDPCGLGVSDVLRQDIARLAKEGKHNLNKLLEEVAGQAWKVDEDDLAAYLIEATSASLERVTHRLGEAAKLLPAEVVERLANADRRLEGARSAKRIEDYLGYAYAALESVFGWLVSLYPDPSLSLALGKDNYENATFLRKISEQLGFEPINVCVTRGQVRSAIESGKGVLAPRLAAALLAAQSEVNHPLVALAARAPRALVFLEEISAPRNKASHYTDATGKEVEANTEEALQIRNKLFLFIRNLVGAGAADAEKVTSSPTWGEIFFLRIRAQAERIADKYTGLEDYPDLRIRMIEMFEAALLLKLLSCSTTTPPDTVRASLRDAMVAIAITMEAVFFQIKKASLTPKDIAQEIRQRITSDREMNAQQLICAASEIGFALDEKGGLPKCISHANTDRVQRAAKDKGETLSATVFVLVLAASRQPEHPLRELAVRIPSLLSDIGRLVDARGHGDVIPQWVTAAIAEEIKEMVAKTALTVIEVID